MPDVYPEKRFRMQETGPGLEEEICRSRGRSDAESGSVSIVCRYAVVLCALLVLLVCMASPSRAGQAYKRFVTNNAGEQYWRDGISVFLQTDVERCRRAYGDRWVSECSAPMPGRVGSRVTGIRMTPSVPGEWRWTSDSAMKFTPKTRLSPATTYTISLDQLELSKRIEVARRLVYTTPPQAVNIQTEKLWIDPSSKGQHVLSVPMAFIWPVSREQMEKSITLDQPKSSLRLGQPSFVWNEDADSVVLNVPVLQLPEKNTAVGVKVSGMGSWHYDNGRVFEKNARQALRRCPVPGVDSVMNVQNVEVRPLYDTSLNRGYEVVVTTTLQTLPRDVLSSMDIRLLPRKSQPSGSRDCNWELMPAISAEDIAKADVVKAELLQPGDEPATETHFRVDVDAGRGLMVAMKTGLASTGGFTLNRVSRFIRTVPALSPEINFLQPGNILPLRAGQKIDVHTIGIDRLEWRAAEIRSPFLSMLAQRAGFSSIDDVEFDALTTVREGVVELQKNAPYRAQYTALDLAGLEKRKTAQSSLMLLTLRGYAGSEEKCSVRRLILLSDLGIMLKTAANGVQHVFVRRISSGAPVRDCDVSLLGANGVAVQKGRTNGDGRCDLPSTYGLDREKKPCALLATHSGDFAWLSMSDPSVSLDFGNYAVQGRHAQESGLLASVFSERGIYMPGETLHFGTIVANQNWTPLGENMAVTGILTGPSGQELHKEKKRLPGNGMTTFAWTSHTDSPTGTYRLDVVVEHGSSRSVLGSMSVRVEEFQPDTLALRLGFLGQKPDGWFTVGGSRVQVRVGLDTLYGEPARGNRIRATFRAEPARLTFPGYSDYSFMEGNQGGDSETIELPEGFTNDQGELILDLPLEKLGAGTRRGILQVEGFESGGGRAVGRTLQALFSPRTHVLGWKPEGEANTLTYLPEGSAASLRLLVLDSRLERERLDNVTVRVSARRFVTSLVQDTTGLYRYDATPVDTELSQKTISLDQKGTVWQLDTGTAGDYLLTVQHDDEILALIPYTVAGNRLAEPGSEPVYAHGNLNLTLDRETFAPGDTIHFRISAPFAGTGLVTLERDTVVASAWFTASVGESVHTLTIPRDFEGRGYVNVSFVRSVDSDAIYMQPHVYAVQPITCGVQARDMGLTLAAGDSILPGQELTVHVDARKPGMVQLFAVDEGVLQLTGFTVPSPLRDLLTDRALDVETREAFSLLMADHERLRGRIPGFGGGMGGVGGRFLNPFRRKSEPPFAFWSEPLEVGAGGRDVKIRVPSYFSGTMRIMAVGSGLGSDGLLCAGSAERTARVRGELILKPELPLVVAPKDQFTGAVVVANTVANSGKNARILVDVLLPPELKSTDRLRKIQLTVPENEERSLTFSASVADALGAYPVKFRAVLEGTEHRMERTQELSIRPATPKTHTETMRTLASLGNLQNGVTMEAEKAFYPHEAETTLTLAAAPVLTMRSILDRLDTYPFGCTEQKISQALPYVVLYDRPALRRQVLRNPRRSLEKQMELGDRRIADAISAIRASLQYDGVSAWPNGETDLFMTAYAADFLLSLKEHGLHAPEDLTEELMTVLERESMNTPAGVTDGRNKIYAAWILQRDGRIMTSALNSLEDWFSRNVNNWEGDVLASLLADSFASLRLSRRARERLPKDVQTTSDPLFSVGMARALHALIVQKDFAAERRTEGLVGPLEETALSSSATTVDMAMSARALAEIAAGTKASSMNARVTCEEYYPEFAGTQEEEIVEDGLIRLQAPGCRRFGIRASGPIPDMSVLLTEHGYEKSLNQTGRTRNLEVRKTLVDERDAPVKTAGLGDVVTARICARSHGSVLDDAVIVDLVPGGLEPVLDRKSRPEGEGLTRFEAREDRGIFFVQLLPDSERCFSYRLRAATKGHFVVPGAEAEGMYLPSQYGLSPQSELDIR